MGDYALNDIGDNGDADDGDNEDITDNGDNEDADNGDNGDTDSKPGYDYYATYDEDSSAVKSGHDYEGFLSYFIVYLLLKWCT